MHAPHRGFAFLNSTQEEPISLCAEHQGKESSAGLREDAAEGRGRLELIPGPPLASAARLGHSSWTAGLPEQVRALASPPSQRHSGPASGPNAAHSTSATPRLKGAEFSRNIKP